MLISDFFQVVVENVCALTFIIWPRFNWTKSENNSLPDHGNSIDYELIIESRQLFSEKVSSLMIDWALNTPLLIIKETVCPVLLYAQMYSHVWKNLILQLDRIFSLSVLCFLSHQFPVWIYSFCRNNLKTLQRLEAVTEKCSGK